MPVAIELRRQPPLGDGHPDRVGEALAERPGRRLDARRQAVLGMARGPRAPLPERLEVVEREVVAGQVEHRVQQHRGVPGAQDEAVAVRPVGVRRGVAEEARPERVGHRRRTHRRARMPRVRLLDAVDRQGPDGVDRQAVEVGADIGGHGWALRSGTDGVSMAPGRCARSHCRRRAILDRPMPTIRPPRPHRPRRRSARPRRRHARAARIVVVGDLMLDVVLAPERALDTGTDVPGRVSLVQGGSAASTARWLGRLGARTTLISAVGRDAAGRALVDAVRSDHVTARVMRVTGVRTGRIGVLVAPDGERSFVADRGAADRSPRPISSPAWFRNADAVHLPVYSLLGEPLGLAGRRAVEMGRAAGAVVSVDLASIGPLLAHGRRAAGR